MALTASAALADTTVIVVQPDAYAQSFADTVKRSQQAWQQTGRQLGTLLVPQVTGIVIGMQCGKYTNAVIGYSNGTQKSLAAIPQDDATQQHLKMLIEATPNATVVELGCAP